MKAWHILFGGDPDKDTRMSMRWTCGEPIEPTDFNEECVKFYAAKEVDKKIADLENYSDRCTLETANAIVKKEKVLKKLHRAIDMLGGFAGEFSETQNQIFKELKEFYDEHTRATES